MEEPLPSICGTETCAPLHERPLTPEAAFAHVQSLHERYRSIMAERAVTVEYAQDPVGQVYHLLGNALQYSTGRIADSKPALVAQALDKTLQRLDECEPILMQVAPTLNPRAALEALRDGFVARAQENLLDR